MWKTLIINILLAGIPALVKWLQNKQDKVIKDKVNAIAEKYEAKANVDPNAITDIIKK